MSFTHWQLLIIICRRIFRADNAFLHRKSLFNLFNSFLYRKQSFSAGFHIFELDLSLLHFILSDKSHKRHSQSVCIIEVLRNTATDYINICVHTIFPELFSNLDLPLHLRNETVSEQEHLAAQRRGLLLVAIEDGIKPVGFAISTRVDSNLHLLEIDVHPRYQRKGIGSALLERIISLAKDHGCEAVTLTTHKYVAWNVPWYEKHGFCILGDDNMPTYLRSILDREKEKGFDPKRRVAMRKDTIFKRSLPA